MGSRREAMGDSAVDSRGGDGRRRADDADAAPGLHDQDAPCSSRCTRPRRRRRRRRRGAVGVAGGARRRARRSGSCRRDQRDGHAGALNAPGRMVREEGVLSLYRGPGASLTLGSHASLRFHDREHSKAWLQGRGWRGGGDGGGGGGGGRRRSGRGARRPRALLAAARTVSKVCATMAIAPGPAVRSMRQQRAAVGTDIDALDSTVGTMTRISAARAALGLLPRPRARTSRALGRSQAAALHARWRTCVFPARPREEIFCRDPGLGLRRLTVTSASGAAPLRCGSYCPRPAPGPIVEDRMPFEEIRPGGDAGLGAVRLSRHRLVTLTVRDRGRQHPRPPSRVEDQLVVRRAAPAARTLRLQHLAEPPVGAWSWPGSDRARRTIMSRTPTSRCRPPRRSAGLDSGEQPTATPLGGWWPPLHHLSARHTPPKRPGRHTT